MEARNQEANEKPCAADLAALMRLAVLSSDLACRESAIQVIVNEWGHHLLTIIRHRLHHRVRRLKDSTDILQSVWGDFFAHRLPDGVLDDPERLVRYLVGIARHKVANANRKYLQYAKYDLGRQRSLSGAALAELSDRKPTPQEVAILHEEEERTAELAGRVLRLFQEGRSPGEIACEIGLPEKVIRRFLFARER
jgi:hypothetical protein